MLWCAGNLPRCRLPACLPTCLPTRLPARQPACPPARWLTLPRDFKADCNATNWTRQTLPVSPPYPHPHSQMVLSDGSQRRMEDVCVGDLVLTAGPGGLAAHQQQLEYRPVYLLAHAEQEIDAVFVHLMANASTSAGGEARTLSLRLSQQHYIPVRSVASADSSSAAAWSYKYARDVMVGDTVRVLDGQGMGVGEALVARVSISVERGLYNPLVFGGLPVVDGVVASDQSEWVLDGVVPADATPQLPRLYSALFAPLRWAYLALGPRVWGQVIAPAVAHLGHTYGSLLFLHLPALALAAAVVARKALPLL